MAGSSFGIYDGNTTQAAAITGCPSRKTPTASQWVARYAYDASGRLLKITSGVEGKTSTATTYSYDQQGRLPDHRC